MLLNVPLVFLSLGRRDLRRLGQQRCRPSKHWSISGQFADFSRGVLSLGRLAYFLVILVVMLYVSMVLIGRRHWFSGGGRWAWSATTSSARWPWAVGRGPWSLFRHHDLRST